MKATVLQKDFKRALTLASKFTAARTQLPVLGNIKLSANKSQLLVQATNLEISISTSTGVNKAVKGEIAVPARMIVDLIANLPSETIDLSVSGERLSVTTENFKGKVNGMNTSDFPVIPTGIEGVGIDLKSNDFVEALSQVLFSVSPDATRPTLAGVLVEIDGSTLRLVSSDGFRLSKKEIKLQKSQKKSSMIIPKNILNEISRAMKDDEESLKFQEKREEKQALFDLGGTVFASRIVEGDFPDYNKIIPSSSRVSVSVDKQELLQAIKVISVFAREQANVIALSAKEGGIFVRPKESDEDQIMKVDAKVIGGEVEIYYNWRFLEEFLGAVHGDEIAIELNDSTSPGVFRDPKDTDYLHLIMPVRS